MPQTLTRYSRQMTQQYPIVEFKQARIVVPPTRYGMGYCFHIDPGDGSTIPVYIGAPIEDQAIRAVTSLMGSLADICAAEVEWAIGDRSGTKLYFTSIKESNASH